MGTEVMIAAFMTVLCCSVFIGYMVGILKHWHVRIMLSYIFSRPLCILREYVPIS